VDHILQEFNTLFLTRFRTYKIASPPQTKMTSKDDIKGLMSLKFLRPCIRGFDNVDSATWLQRVDVSIRTTRSAADPLNLEPQAARLQTRRNFFSKRVVEAWNMVPGEIKRSKTVSSIKNPYRRHRENTVENA
jgi:hypothetical protein